MSLKNKWFFLHKTSLMEHKNTTTLEIEYMNLKLTHAQLINKVSYWVLLSNGFNARILPKELLPVLNSRHECQRFSSTLILNGPNNA